MYVYYISYISLHSFMSIEQSVKEFNLISYFLFYHNSSDICASASFRRLQSASASQSWCVRHVRDIALEVAKEKIPDSSALVDSNPSTMILHKLNLTLTMGSRFLLIGVNGLGKPTLLCILGGRHITPPESDVCVLSVNLFRITKFNFHPAYIGTNWACIQFPS